MFDMLQSQLTGWPIGLSQPLQSPVKTNILEMKILRALQEWRMDARSNNLHFEVLWWDIAKWIASPSTASPQHLTQREWWELSVPAPQLPIIQTTQATLCPINLLSLPLYSAVCRWKYWPHLTCAFCIVSLLSHSLPLAFHSLPLLQRLCSE